MRSRAFASVAVALVAFSCYRATLLPGLDFGDTASFQTSVGSLTLTPRQAYPLYYALGNLFVWTSDAEPAHAANLASAIYGALGCGVLVWVAAVITESTLAGVAAGLLLAFSYTFWSQAVIAEVYTLHILLIGLSLSALLAWSHRPGFPRLALFYAAYALGFGNHLSTILLLPGYAALLLMEQRRGPYSPLRPKALALACVIALAGALPYIWNFRGLWRTASPPASLGEALASFWFDVTKADWRASLVLTVSEAGLRNRPAMYWFDLRQQFGLVAIALALMGLAYLILRRRAGSAAYARRVGLMLAIIYFANLLFAWTYNVGDVHVFFLPSHFVVALLAGAGTAFLISSSLRLFRQRAFQAAIAGIVLAYAAWRGHDTYPAVDRSDDRRPTELLDALTKGLDSRSSVFAVDSNWQLQNAFEYYAREHRPDLAWFATDEIPHPIELAKANAHNGRSIVGTGQAAARLTAEDEETFDVLTDVQPEALSRQVGRLPSGTVYTLSVLRPYVEFPIDREDLADASRSLSGQVLPIDRNYIVVIGRKGAPPIITRASDRPFRQTATIGDLHFDVRMESWLPTDTIRRAGFGHVILDHRHAMTLERGVSLLALTPEGRVGLRTYAAGLFAPQPRYLLRLRQG